MPSYLCQPCNDSFQSEKLWDEHLSEHDVNASDFP